MPTKRLKSHKLRLNWTALGLQIVGREILQWRGQIRCQLASFWVNPLTPTVAIWVQL